MTRPSQNGITEQLKNKFESRSLNLLDAYFKYEKKLSKPIARSIKKIYLALFLQNINFILSLQISLIIYSKITIFVMTRPSQNGITEQLQNKFESRFLNFSLNLQYLLGIVAQRS